MIWIKHLSLNDLCVITLVCSNPFSILLFLFMYILTSSISFKSVLFLSPVEAGYNRDVLSLGMTESSMRPGTE